jgi:hypothetical protein
MKKVLIIALFAVAVVSIYSFVAKKQTKRPDGWVKFRTEVVDSCEYVYFLDVSGGGMCHKGNCSNPVHKNN